MNQVFVVMGVSGSGKSTIARLLAKFYHVKYIDGDDLHPRSNLLKMQSGASLTTQDRLPWLQRINDVIFSLQLKKEGAFVVCSALRQEYRQALRNNNQKIIFIYLSGTLEVLQKRVANRQHFMPQSLLTSQLATVEEATHEEVDVYKIDIDHPLNDLLEQLKQLVDYHKNL